MEIGSLVALIAAISAAVGGAGVVVYKSWKSESRQDRDNEWKRLNALADRLAKMGEDCEEQLGILRQQNNRSFAAVNSKVDETNTRVDTVEEKAYNADAKAEQVRVESQEVKAEVDAAKKLAIRVNAQILADSNGVVLDANPAAVVLFRYSNKSAMIGLSAEGLMPQRYRLRHRAGLAKFVHTAESKEIVVKGEYILAADGIEIAADVYVRAEKASSGFVFGATIVERS